jgi:hypothetical protein
MMAASAISASSRYFNRGTTKVIFATTISSTAAPTRSEINAGTDLSNEVAEIEGWMVQSEPIETPDLGRVFTSKIPGPTSADDSSLTMYTDVGGSDVRTLLPRNTSGYIIWMDGGDTAGRKMDVFPVRVSSQGKSRSTEADAATIEIMFAITAEPSENVTIPS